MRRNEMEERRHSVGPLKPTVYLMLEVTMLVLLVYMAAQIGIQGLVTVTMMTTGAYFISSCLPRYFRVLERQRMMPVRPMYAY
jgi:hypothetical protein